MAIPPWNMVFCNIILGLSLVILPFVLGDKQGCPHNCQCPMNDTCTTGTSKILDTCGCGCDVCMQEQGSVCDGLRPCNSAQNLICEYPNLHEQLGICKVTQSCSHNGTLILHGQEFRMECHSDCKCNNGTIICVPTCSSHKRFSELDCKEMHLVSVPGECCMRWKCSEKTDWQTPQLDKNEPIMAQMNNSLEVKQRHSREAPDRDDADPRTKQKLCNKYPTEWTPCSRSCGFGYSMRIKFKKQGCIPRAEKRLCMVRPCKGDYPTANYTLLNTTKSCNRVVRWIEPLKLNHRGCHSQRPLRPRFCGLCADGRQCLPSHTETRSMSFECPHSVQKVTRQFMWVTNCHCRRLKNRKAKGKNQSKKRKEVGEADSETDV